MNIDEYFDQEQEFSDYAGTDADVESMKSIQLSKQNAFEILKEPTVLEKNPNNYRIYAVFQTR